MSGQKTEIGMLARTRLEKAGWRLSWGGEKAWILEMGVESFCVLAELNSSLPGSVWFRLYPGSGAGWNLHLRNKWRHWEYVQAVEKSVSIGSVTPQVAGFVACDLVEMHKKWYYREEMLRDVLSCGKRYSNGSVEWWNNQVSFLILEQLVWSRIVNGSGWLSSRLRTVVHDFESLLPMFCSQWGKFHACFRRNLQGLVSSGLVKRPERKGRQFLHFANETLEYERLFKTPNGTALPSWFVRDMSYFREGLIFGQWDKNLLGQLE